jgi:hypothetical protein
MCIHNNSNENCEICELCDDNDHKKPNHNNIITNNANSERRLKIADNYCEHNNLKKNCTICEQEMCEHNKIKNKCKKCAIPCKTIICEKKGNIKYENYCSTCYKKLLRPIKNKKEKNVVEQIMNKYPDFTWIQDKTIEDGYSRKRPDLLCNFGFHVMIIEIDEHSHRKYNNMDENKRIMLLSHDLSYQPIVLIRFNPDDYINEHGKLITSCWTLKKVSKKIKKMELKKTKEQEWATRMESLFNTIKYWSENKTEKTVEIIKLYYDKN